MTQPTLSIITVNFNNNKGLIATLNSIKNQSFTSYEHIIIDACSTDGSKETIITRSLPHHLISRNGQSLDDCRDGRDYA